MNRLSTLLKPAAMRPLSLAGALLVIVAALLPWATFVLNDGPYPDKSTLQFFDAPFAVTGYRLDLLLFALAALVVTFVPLPSRGRVLRGLGWGTLVIALVNTVFIAVKGGGLGAVTAADGATAFGGLVGLIGAAALILGGIAAGTAPPPRWRSSLPIPMAWISLLIAFGGLLMLVSMTLTAGGQGGVANAYAGPIFLSFVGFAGGLLAALQGIGLLPWISALSERHRLFSIAVLLLCGLALPFTQAGTEYWMTVAANIGIYAATAIGLNVVVGLAGLLDLGYVAFMGIGAFTAANLSGAAAAKVGVHLPFFLAAVISAVVAGIFGAVVGSPTLRVRGDYLAIVTLAFGEIFTRVAQNNIGGLTGGSNAIPNVPNVSLFGYQFNEAITIGGVQLPNGVLYYFLIVLLVGGTMAVFGNLKNSRIGRAWIAVREDEDAARAMGIQTGRVKILAFLVGATLAGLAGAVFAHKTSTVAYDSFKFLESVTLLAAIILGGMGTIPGAVLGASLLFVLPEKLREFSDYRLLIFGAALVLIMRFRPQGLVSDRHRRAELVGEDPEGMPLEEVRPDEHATGGHRPGTSGHGPAGTHPGGGHSGAPFGGHPGQQGGHPGQPLSVRHAGQLGHPGPPAGPPPAYQVPPSQPGWGPDPRPARQGGPPFPGQPPHQTGPFPPGPQPQQRPYPPQGPQPQQRPYPPQGAQPQQRPYPPQGPYQPETHHRHQAPPHQPPPQ